MKFEKYLFFTFNLIIVFLINGFNLSAQNIPLFIEGKSEYVINLPKNPSVKCSKAVDELRIFLKEITGIQLPCSDKFFENAKYIVFEENYCSDKQFDINKLNNDGFRIKNNRRNIFITARDGQGLINAVYSFLEKYIGCRYYSADEIYIPKLKNILISNLTEDIQNPKFTFRTIHYFNAYQAEYSALNKLNSTNEDRISMDWGGLWVHSFHKLLSPEKYFSTHPEYFAYKNGRRISDQLCLSNPEVLKIVISSLDGLMKKIPYARYWSVSQMDNENFCECDKCLAIDNEEDSPSGSIINFVNQVAARFPDKVISTLAYKYSRKPPLHLIPSENVNIMLCAVESDRSKPIADNYADGSFYDDLSDWSLITNNIIVWDYVTNFSHYLSPFPNFHVLQPNLKLFSNYGAEMIFEQGNPSQYGEMNELRCYLLSKLIWNPDEDVDSLMNDFLRAYYGKASVYIRRYLDLSNEELIKSEIPLDMYDSPVKHAEGFLSVKNLEKYLDLFEKALEMLKDDSVKTMRVNMAMQSVRYAWLEVSKTLVYKDGWVFQLNPETNAYTVNPKAIEILNTFYSYAQKFGPKLLNEAGFSADEYFIKYMEYINHTIVNHKAVGKKISFSSPYSRRYCANGQYSLIDGIKGCEECMQQWQAWSDGLIDATIDFDTLVLFNSVSVSFLDDYKAWILPPKSIEISISDNGKNFKSIINYQNPNAGKKQSRQIISFNIPFNKSEKGRFFKIKINSIGKLPAWHGANENAWMFVDEIIVK